MKLHCLIQYVSASLKECIEESLANSCVHKEGDIILWVIVDSHIYLPGFVYSGAKYFRARPLHSMFTISLHEITIHTLLGLFPEEQKIPNRFEVDADLQAPEEALFMDYGIMREVVTTEMLSGKYQKLEQACKGIMNALHREFPQAQKGTITIRKYTLPFGAPVRYSQVRLEREWK